MNMWMSIIHIDSQFLILLKQSVQRITELFQEGFFSRCCFAKAPPHDQTADIENLDKPKHADNHQHAYYKINKSFTFIIQPSTHQMNQAILYK